MLSVKVEDAKPRAFIVLGEVVPRGWKGNTTEYGLNLALDPFLHLSFSHLSSCDLNPTSLVAF